MDVPNKLAVEYTLIVVRWSTDTALHSYLFSLLFLGQRKSYETWVFTTDLLLLIILFANIFSHSLGYFFTLFMVSFIVQELLSLIQSHLFIVVFISIPLGDGSKEILLKFMSVSCLSFPEFYSIRSYI